VESSQDFRNSSGSLAIFAAIRRASSFVSNFAADLRPGSSSISILSRQSMNQDRGTELQGLVIDHGIGVIAHGTGVIDHALQSLPA
jgi:hypothetical protein